MRPSTRHLPSALPALVVVLALTLALLLGGCGGGDDAEVEPTPAPSRGALILQAPDATTPAR